MYGMNIHRQPIEAEGKSYKVLTEADGDAFHPLHTSTRVSLPYSSLSHCTNCASSLLNGLSSNDITSFGVKHSLGLRAGSRLVPAESVTP